jgi:multimeric flavodoxin WrbA
MANRKPTKKDNKPDILFISGSPRDHTCVALIELIEQGARHAGAKTQRFLLSKKRIDPCIGCGGCDATGNCVFAGKARGGHFTDDYLELKAVLERVDALAIVAPLYFAGPPAQLKALYDRMQPYWAQRYLLGHDASEKRPAQLFVVGGGGDAHGHAPLVGSTKSAMAVAGFNLEKVNNFIVFASPHDVPAFPREDEAEQYSHAQLAQLRRLVARQEGFVQRALDAGGAFARFVVKKKQANDLAQQLAAVEAELEALRKIGDATQPSEPPPTSAQSAARAVTALDHKGDLQAEIDLEYRNLISRTPRETVTTQPEAKNADEVRCAEEAPPDTVTLGAPVTPVAPAAPAAPADDIANTAAPPAASDATAGDPGEGR